MTQVWLIDENGFYTGVMDFVENPTESEIIILPNGFYRPKWNGEKWIEGATQEEIDKINKIDICLDELKIKKIQESKLELEKWLLENPLYSMVHNVNGEYYSVTQEKQSLLTQNILLCQLKQTDITTWNSTSNVCEEWNVAKLSQLALEIETYVRPRITKQQHYEVAINLCTTKEELDVITFDYEVI